MLIKKNVRFVLIAFPENGEIPLRKRYPERSCVVMRWPLWDIHHKYKWFDHVHRGTILE